MPNWLLIGSPFIITIICWGLAFWLLSGFWFYVACFVCILLTLACAVFYFFLATFRVQ